MDAFVTKIDLQLADTLKEELQAQGFTLSKPPYTLFSGKKKGVSCTLYQSGKLMVQGKDKKDFIEFYLEPHILKDFSFTNPQNSIDRTPRIGIDEAGKGDYFGPLCVAGVYADENGIEELIALKVKDSKRMNDERICTLASKIRSKFPHSIIRLFPSKYNELYEKFKNLNRLLAWGHATAIEELVLNTQCHNVLIDQFAKEDVVEKALERKQLDLSLTQRHKGEEDLVVAAASILARAAFVEGIKKLGDSFDLTLPKGANAQVVAVGRKVFAKGGLEALKQVGKLHFQTTGAVTHA